MDHAASDHVFVEEGRRGCGPGCQLVVSACKCGLRRRFRIIERTVRTVEVKLPGGVWTNPVALLRLELPYMLCPRCKGPGCETCRSLGVVEIIKPRTSGSTG